MSWMMYAAGGAAVLLVIVMIVVVMWPSGGDGGGGSGGGGGSAGKFEGDGRCHGGMFYDEDGKCVTQDPSAVDGTTAVPIALTVPPVTTMPVHYALK